MTSKTLRNGFEMDLWNASLLLTQWIRLEEIELKTDEEGVYKEVEFLELFREKALLYKTWLKDRSSINPVKCETFDKEIRHQIAKLSSIRLRFMRAVYQVTFGRLRSICDINEEYGKLTDKQKSDFREVAHYFDLYQDDGIIEMPLESDVSTSDFDWDEWVFDELTGVGEYFYGKCSKHMFLIEWTETDNSLVEKFKHWLRENRPEGFSATQTHSSTKEYTKDLIVFDLWFIKGKGLSVADKIKMFKEYNINKNNTENAIRNEASGVRKFLELCVFCNQHTLKNGQLKRDTNI